MTTLTIIMIKLFVIFSSLIIIIRANHDELSSVPDELSSVPDELSSVHDELSPCRSLTIDICREYCNCALCHKANNETFCLDIHDEDGHESNSYAICLMNHHIEEPSDHCSWLITPVGWVIIVSSIVIVVCFICAGLLGVKSRDNYTELF